MLQTLNKLAVREKNHTRRWYGDRSGVMRSRQFVVMQHFWSFWWDDVGDNT